jgi:hypothetical protein
MGSLSGTDVAESYVALFLSFPLLFDYKVSPISLALHQGRAEIEEAAEY